MNAKDIFQKLHRLVVPVYRGVAVLTLYGVLLLVVSWGFVMIFYAANSSWSAPIIISPTNDKILAMTARIVASQQVLASLTVDRDHQLDSLGDMKKTALTLNRLDGQFQSAITTQEHNNKTDGPELFDLNQQKKSDNEQTLSVMSEIAGVEAQIDKDLKAGLIGKADAALAKAALNQNKLTFTDSKVTEVLLRDNVRQKTSKDVSVIDTLSKEAQLKSAAVQLQILIRTGETQLQSDLIQIKQLNEAIATAKSSPYFLATNEKVQFAFVPYANQAHAKVGAPVYGCYLNMLLCRKVGNVKTIFKDEETITHPVFRTDVRGFMVQLELTDNETAKDQVLFLGYKPLLF